MKCLKKIDEIRNMVMEVSTNVYLENGEIDDKDINSMLCVVAKLKFML
jgi:hypothetical protein